MIRILIAFLLALILYPAVLSVSYWLIIPMMAMQLLAGLDAEIFD